jgi:sulfur-carrier protein
MAAVTLRYWAAAKEAAGVAEEQVEALTLADALRAAVLARGGGGADRAERYALVLARSSFLINGDPVGKRPPESVPLPEGAVIEVLPPFAGG